MIKYHVQYERYPLRTAIIGLPAVWCFLLLAVKCYKGLAILLAGTIAVWLFVRWLCGRLFVIRHSNVGRELMKYGDLKQVMQDVEEQVKHHSCYVTTDQAITEKYLVLVQPNEEYSMAGSFWCTQNRFCLLSTSDIMRVEVQAEERYADEMSTLVFHTLLGEQYHITIYRSWEEVLRIKEVLEHCARQGRGPVRVRTGEMEEEAVNGRKKSRQRKRHLQQYESGHTIAECYAGKKKMFAGVTAAIVFVVAAMLIWVFRWEQYTLARFMRDLYEYPLESALVAALYIIPITGCYLLIRIMERQVKSTYNRLKHYEQIELDSLIAKSPEIKAGDVIYAERCFWFRDSSRLFFHNLVLYEDVVWIYQSFGAFSGNMEGIDMPVMRMSKIVFHTTDGRKHSILMADWNTFLRCFPQAIKGYGKQQKKAYREKRLL